MDKLKISLPLIFILLGFVGVIQSAGNCKDSAWVHASMTEEYNCDKLTAKKAPHPLYQDVMMNNYTFFICCPTDPNPRQVENLGEATEHCFMSKCSTRTLENYCPVRYGKGKLEGKVYNYDEIFREPCFDDTGEKRGISGLCCKKKSVEGQLAAAVGAEVNEFPFIARITADTNCGATVYNSQYLITAAHCVLNKNHEVIAPKDVRVSIGSNFGDTLAQNKLYRYTVEKVIPHQNYSSMEDNYKLYGDKVLWDVALLKLNEPVRFGPTVKSLQIAPASFEPRDYSDKLVIAGWGTTDTGKQAPHLQRTDLWLRDPDRCFAKSGGVYHQMDEFRDQLLCVGGIMDGKWNPIAGKGDSGGPAICRASDGTAVHCGVTSFGSKMEPCQDNPNEKTCTPSVYARVSAFRDWIEENAGDQDKNTFFHASLYGEQVADEEYKHQVHITSNGGKSCGGTLVSPDTVVTAAMCVADDKGTLRSGVRVHYGIKDLKQKSTSEPFKTKGISILDGFKMIGAPVKGLNQGNRIIITDNNYKNNLAVIKLDGNAPIDPSELPRLPKSGEMFVEGKELALPRNEEFGTRMVSNEYKILDKKVCQQRMNRLGNGKGKNMGKTGGEEVDENILCAVEKFSGGSRCDRELGGGLICKGEDDKHDVLCGVQAFRLCEYSIPNAFMDMSKQLEWMKKYM